ncbi:Uncharacterised protein [uncultured archaeon]|nr:Uncharacterised protein [uncultured archaeon]
MINLYTCCGEERSRRVEDKMGDNGWRAYHIGDRVAFKSDPKIHDYEIISGQITQIVAETHYVEIGVNKLSIADTLHLRIRPGKSDIALLVNSEALAA